MTSASASSVLSARFAGWALPTLLAAAAAVFAAVDAWLGRRRVAALRSECSKLRELRAAERAGRTAAERRLRHAQVFRPDLPASSPAWSATAPSPSPALCTYRPIGRIESCYAERRGTPRQGLLVPAARARLRLDPQVIQPTAALEGLDGFSHVWLIFDFHENTNACKAAAAVANTGGGASTVSSCGNGGGGASGSATGSNGGASSRKALSRPARPFPQVGRAILVLAMPVTPPPLSLLGSLCLLVNALCAQLALLMSSPLPPLSPPSLLRVSAPWGKRGC